MERKVFYTMIHKRNSSEVKQVDGFEFAINGNKFYGYANRESNRVYIIDPETGRSIYDYPIFDECQEIEAMKYTIDRLIEEEYILEAFERKKNSPEYESMKEIFKFFFCRSKMTD